MTSIVQFLVNGQKYYVKRKITLLDLITYFNYNHSLLVLEHNNLVCSQEGWENKVISNLDQIEIVTIVGGG